MDLRRRHGQRGGVLRQNEDQINAFLDESPARCLRRSRSGFPSRTTCCPVRSSCSEGGDRLDARDERAVRKQSHDRDRDRLRARGIRGERSRASRHHRADRRVGRGNPRDRLRPRQGNGNWRPRGIRRGLLAGVAIGCLCKHNATLAGGRRRLPGRNGRRLGDGRCDDRGGLEARRRLVAKTANLRSKSSRRDLRSGRRVSPGSLHRTLRFGAVKASTPSSSPPMRSEAVIASISTPRSRPWPRRRRT